MPYGLCSSRRRTCWDVRGHVVVTNCPSRRLRPDGDGNTVNVGKGCPCPMKGPASLRVEQKGHPGGATVVRTKLVKTSGGKGGSCSWDSRRVMWRSKILEQGEHLPSPKTTGPHDRRDKVCQRCGKARAEEAHHLQRWSQRLTMDPPAGWDSANGVTSPVIMMSNGELGTRKRVCPVRRGVQGNGPAERQVPRFAPTLLLKTSQGSDSLTEFNKTPARWHSGDRSA